MEIKVYSIVILLTYFQSMTDLSYGNVKCVMCWALDANLAAENTTRRSLQDQLLEGLSAAGISTEQYTSDLCKLGAEGQGEWKEPSNATQFYTTEMGEYDCDGTCTKRHFIVDEIDVTIFQRTCMTKTILEGQPCIEMEEDDSAGKPYGLKVISTATCCSNEDYCNSADHTKPYFYYYLSLIAFSVISYTLHLY